MLLAAALADAAAAPVSSFPLPFPLLIQYGAAIRVDDVSLGGRVFGEEGEGGTFLIK